MYERGRSTCVLTMSEGIPIVAQSDAQQAGNNSSAVTLSLPDPYRDPVISHKPRNGKPPTNIYPYSSGEISPVHQPLFRTTRKILRKNIEEAIGLEAGNTEYELLMCGISPQAAEPALVIRCPMNNMEKIQKVLTQESLLKRCQLRPRGAAARFLRRIRQKLGSSIDGDELILGLEIYGCGTPTRPPVRTELGGDTLDVSGSIASRYGSDQWFSPLYGAGINSIRGNASATCTGVIEIGAEIYGLTTSHPFRKDAVWKSRGFSVHRIGNMKGYVITVEVVLRNSCHSIRTKVWVPTITSFTSTIPNLDWALIILQGTPLFDYGSKISKAAPQYSSSSTYALKHPEREPEVLILSCDEQPKRGTLLQGIVYHTSYLSAEIALWTLALDENRSVEHGDSGSLVIEADAGIAYGYVVARDTFGRAEIIPLHNTLEQISYLIGNRHVTFRDGASFVDGQNLVRGGISALEELQLDPPLSSETSSTVAEDDKLYQIYGNEALDTARHVISQSNEAPTIESEIRPAISYKRTYSRGDYQIGIFCALDVEIAAATALLDEEHLVEQSNDLDNYILGRLSNHNVVIVCGQRNYDVTSTAIEVQRMQSSFYNLCFGLMFGIGGGAPSPKHDIRLGDVVVGTGVIQLDFGQAPQGHECQMTSYLEPPDIILRAIAEIQSKHTAMGYQIVETLEYMLNSNESRKARYSHPGAKYDRLYKTEYTHKEHGFCDCQRPQDWRNHDQIAEQMDRLNEAEERVLDQLTLKRPTRKSKDGGPVLHYGVIASGSTVMKDAWTRDTLAEAHDVLCFEMEAAGLLNNFPCVVIKGISDYADSHKNDMWQGYAAATAAAGLKELLSAFQHEDISALRSDAEARKHYKNQAYDIPFSLPQDVSLPWTMTGLSSEMQKLKETLLPTLGNNKCDVVWLHGISGIGGIGKTQLALQFVHTFKNDFSAVFWLDGSSTDSLKQSMAYCATRIFPNQSLETRKVHDSTWESKIDVAMQEVFDWLRLPNNNKWIMVIDGLDEECSFETNSLLNSINKHLLKGDHGAILITTKETREDRTKSLEITKVDQISPGNISGDWARRNRRKAASFKDILRLPVSRLFDDGRPS